MRKLFCLTFIAVIFTSFFALNSNLVSESRTTVLRKAKKKKKKASPVALFAGQFTVSNYGRFPADTYKVQFVQISKKQTTFYFAKDVGSSLPVLAYQSSNHKPELKQGSKVQFGKASLSGPYTLEPSFLPTSQETDVLGTSGTMTFYLANDDSAVILEAAPDGLPLVRFTAGLEIKQASTVVVKLKKTTRKPARPGGRVRLVATATNRGPGPIGSSTGALVIALPSEVDSSTISVKSSSLDCTTNTLDPDLVGQIQCVPKGNALNEKKYRASVKITFTAPESLEGTTMVAGAGFLLLDEDTPFLTAAPLNQGLVPGEFRSNSSQVRIKIRGKKTKGTNCDGLIGKYEIRGSAGNLGGIFKFVEKNGFISGTLLKHGDLYHKGFYEIGDTVFKNYVFVESEQKYVGQRAILCCPVQFAEQDISVFDDRLYLGRNTLAPLTCVN